jgi:hypothetical protein
MIFNFYLPLLWFSTNPAICQPEAIDLRAIAESKYQQQHRKSNKTQENFMFGQSIPVDRGDGRE